MMAKLGKAIALVAWAQLCASSAAGSFHDSCAEDATFDEVHVSLLQGAMHMASRQAMVVATPEVVQVQPRAAPSSELVVGQAGPEVARGSWPGVVSKTAVQEAAGNLQNEMKGGVSLVEKPQETAVVKEEAVPVAQKLFEIPVIKTKSVVVKPTHTPAVAASGQGVVQQRSATAAEPYKVVTYDIPMVYWTVTAILAWLVIILALRSCMNNYDLEVREVVKKVRVPVPMVQEVPTPVPVPQVQYVEKRVEVLVPQIVPQIQEVMFPQMQETFGSAIVRDQPRQFQPPSPVISTLAAFPSSSTGSFQQSMHSFPSAHAASSSASFGQLPPFRAAGQSSQPTDSFLISKEHLPSFVPQVETLPRVESGVMEPYSGNSVPYFRSSREDAAY